MQCSLNNGFNTISEHELGDPWTYDDPIKLAVKEIKSADKLGIAVIHDETFGYQNLYIRFRLLAGADTMMIEDVSIPLSNGKGQWLGTPSGTSYRYSHLLTKIEFALDSIPSSSIMTIHQHSREEALSGITEIAIGNFR